MSVLYLAIVVLVHHIVHAMPVIHLAIVVQLEHNTVKVKRLNL